MPVTTEPETRKRSRPWLVLVLSALLLLVSGGVAVAPVFALRGSTGGFHWYTQVTPHSGAGQGLSERKSPGSRGWVLRLGDWHWFLGFDRR